MLRNRVPPPCRRLVGDDHLVVALDQALEREGIGTPGVGPAALEVGGQVDAGVGGAEELQVGGEVFVERARVPVS